MLKVGYYLSVGTTIFSKTISVLTIPQEGSRIEAATNSFIVTSSTQDLDAYSRGDHERGFPCDTVNAMVNTSTHKGDDFSTICAQLINAGWKKTSMGI